MFVTELPFVFSFQEVHVTDNPVILRRQLSSEDLLQAYYYIHDKLVAVDFDLVTPSQLLHSFIILRLAAKLTLVSELQIESIQESFLYLRKKVSSSMSSFHFSNTNVFLLSNDKVSGICDDSTVGDMWSMLRTSESGDSFQLPNMKNEVKASKLKKKPGSRYVSWFII